MTKIVDPLISVVTPSLNHARFLRQTIESVAAQKFPSFEHIIIDGGSTDGSVQILREFPHVKWVSEPDTHVVEAYEKGFLMARGKYVVQCCVSDGFLDPYWFTKCSDVLEKDEEVSLVWGFPQSMSEDGGLLNVSFQDFFADPPPQKAGFLAFWLATGFPLPEGNYCVRRDIIAKWFPDKSSTGWFRICPHLGFMYHFLTQGYSPYFIPTVANFGRTHGDQRSQRLFHIEKPAKLAYMQAVKRYAKDVLRRRTVHYFRDANSRVIGEVCPNDLMKLRRSIWRHHVLRSPLLRQDPYTIALKLWTRLRSRTQWDD